MVTAALMAGLIGAPAPWSVRVLASVGSSAWSAPQEIEARDGATFTKLWGELYANAVRRPTLPPVDFHRERVLVVATGNEPSGGFSVALDSARSRGDSAWIFVSIVTPPPGCGVTQQITSPAMAMALPRGPAHVVVIRHERAASTRCS